MSNKYGLTEDQLSIQEMAKKFADEVVAETVTDLDARHAFPEEEVKQCAEMGFLGICAPEEYGGAGMDHLSNVLVIEQIARHSASLASIIDAHASLGSTPIAIAGTDEQKRKFLTPAAMGEGLCAFALTEPQSGSDAGQIRTKAVLEGDEWVINGSKFDIIFCGKQAIDGDTAQVGPEIAEHMDCPQITYAIEAKVENDEVLVKRETGEGYEVLAAKMPCVITVTKPSFSPRYPTIKSKMAANRATINTLTAADIPVDAERIGLKGSPTKVKKSFTPPQKQGGVVVKEDSPEASAQKLFELLNSAHIV